MTSPNPGPWWVPASRNGKANFITRSNAILLAFVAGLVGAIFGASSSGSLFGHSINLSRVTNSVERAPGSVADIAQRVIPSVVSIEATSKDGGSTGTGFVIESNGYILTNNHVIAEAVSTNGTIDVTLNSGQKYTAKVVGRDSSYDLAVLKIATTGLTALQLGDSDKVAVGDSVIAIGSPLGLSGTVTLGIISAKNRAVTAGESGSDNSFINALQTDAAINPGNSGGPLVNIRGEMIGINVAIYRGDENVRAWQGVGLAVPANDAKSVIDAILAQNKAGKSSTAAAGMGYLGLVLSPEVVAIDSGLGTSLIGAYVTELDPQSPAAIGGLLPGDVITALDDENLSSPRQLLDQIRALTPGTTIKLTLLRNGQLAQLNVKIGQRPDAQ